jgi:uncharacterized protein YeeX (DUF496 family)
MRKGEKLIFLTGEKLTKEYGRIVFPENIYNYIQNEMSDEEFDKILNKENDYY